MRTSWLPLAGDPAGSQSGRTESRTAYDGADKLTAVTGGSNPRTFAYDLAGRTTSIVSGAGTTSMAYDFEGRVTSITYPGSTSDSFGYNGAGARTSTSGINGSKTFRRVGMGVTSPLLSDGITDYTPSVSARSGGATSFQHHGLKNTTSQSSTAQSIAASRQYDAFGNVVAGSGAWTGVHGYAGQFGYQEDGNGLKLLGRRYYDSSSGRFLTRDVGKWGRNWYTYGASNPVSMFDEAGLKPKLILIKGPRDHGLPYFPRHGVRYVRQVL